VVEVVMLLAVAAAGLVVGRMLRLPSIVAFLAAGVVAGPGVLGVVEHTPTTEQLAEIGIALLLFGVGIEFSLAHLRRIAFRMVTTGALQVGLTIAATAAGFHWLGAPWPTAVFAGFLVSLSSTAIVFKLYDERGELDSPPGQAAAGVLLFQDLALVPMMLLIPVLAGPPETLSTAAAMALGRAALALGGLVVLARAVLPPLLRAIARMGTPELFPLAALVFAFGTALGAAELGLSLSIGAFLAGLALSGSPYSHQVFAELLPLRDACVAIFFTSIGLLLQPATVAERPDLLAVMVAAVGMKGLVVAVIVGLLWRSARLGILTGMALAEIGEFSFVLARQGVDAGLAKPVVEQSFLGAALLTMAATPFLMRAGRKLVELTEGSGRATPPAALRDHVLVIGYGVTGQAVGRVLLETGIPFAAVDMVAEPVEQARRDGVPIRFGDASRRGVLEEMGAAHARAAVVAIGDPAATRRIVSQLRQMNAGARILVRARRVHEIDEIERLGADEVVPSEFETSIELFVRLLDHLGVPRHVARVQESLIRLDHYHALRGVGSTPELLAETKKLIAGGILETAQVMAGSEAAGQTLAELNLRRRTGANILSVVRDERPMPTPDGPTRLEAGDLVVLYGPHEAIDKALQLLEPSASGREAVRR
jgi:CPA2 family monovalent cation:H+ antiporter-2